MAITPIAGPAGSGKSQVIAAELRPGGVVIDFTRLYVALAGIERGPDGRYPERQPDDPLVPLVSAVQAFALSEAVKRELDGYVTTASRDRVPLLERITGRPARIVDPGEDVAAARLMVAADVEVDLSDDPVSPRRPTAAKTVRPRQLSDNCRRALARWYGANRRGGGGGRRGR